MSLALVDWLIGAWEWIVTLIASLWAQSDFLLDNWQWLAALVSAFGVLIQTGSKGVLFRFGRARRELDPGFHMLIPGIDDVRKVYCRDTTLDLKDQRLITVDEHVYSVDVNVVFQIDDPTRSVIEIDNVSHGVETCLAWAARSLFAQLRHMDLKDQERLDASLESHVRDRLARWGITVVSAGFNSISPTPATLRASQFAAKAELRRQVYHRLRRQTSATIAQALCGTDARLVVRSGKHRRKRALRRPV